jgi:hypothetical protein
VYKSHVWLVQIVEWNFCIVCPVQLDYPLLPTKPPDRSKVYKTMLSCDQFYTGGVKGISHEIPPCKLVLNCYCFVFASTTEYSCDIMIISQWWIILMIMHSLKRGQFTYAGDQFPKILERYVQSHGKVAVIFSCPCSEQSLEESVEVLTFLYIKLGNEKEHH